MPISDDDVIGAELDFSILAGRNLIPMDGTGLFKMGKLSTSDPYVTVQLGGGPFKNRDDLKGKTEVRPKTLNPEWSNASFKFHLKQGEYKPDHNVLILKIFDRDRGMLDADDPMGKVRIPLRLLQSGQAVEKWYTVEPCEGCAKTTGELRVRASLSFRRALSLRDKQSMRIPPMTTTVACGLGWDLMAGGQAIDLDTSCVCVSFGGDVLQGECVDFANLTSTSGAIRHTGDEREGDEDLGAGDDEIILVDLQRLPRQTCALILVATVASEGRTFRDVKTARIRLVDWTSGEETCRFLPAMGGAHTALFLARIARKAPDAPWHLQAMGDYDHTARDWGTLIPEIKLYCTDLIPSIKVDPSERIAVMRKGGAIRLSDFASGGQVPQALALGLAWSVTNGVEIDLDASAIMLDANLSLLDLVFFGKLRSSDGSIVHGGDEREGDAVGDDERLFLRLGSVHPAVKYIGFCINSYSGQELDDVSDASCHLFDQASGADLATFKLSNAKFLDGYTALLVGMLFRDETGSWGFEIISEAAMGSMAQDNVDELQNFLRRVGPRRAVPPARLPPGAAQGMLSRTAAGAAAAQRQLFDAIDSNHDGAVSYEELMAAAPHLQLDAQNVAALFRQHDTDQSQGLDAAEFAALVADVNTRIASKQQEIAQLEAAIMQRINVTVNVNLT